MAQKESKKMDTTVVIAVIGLIGTIVTALLTSPILLKLLDQSGTPAPTRQVITTAEASATSAPVTNTPATPANTAIVPTPPVGQAQLIFSNNFDDGKTSGFSFQVGAWKIVKDKSNPVLQGDAHGVTNDVATAVFGPSNFSNGIIETRIMFKSTQGVYIGFRGNQTDAYVLYLSPGNGKIVVGLNGESVQWNLQPMQNGESIFNFSQDTWYTVRLQVQGSAITVWVDNNLITSVTDSRLTQGLIFFGIDPEGTVLFDDVKIWQMP